MTILLSSKTKAEKTAGGMFAGTDPGSTLNQPLRERAIPNTPS